MSKRKSSFQRWKEFWDNVPANAHMSQADCRSLKKLMSQRPENVSEQEWNKLFEKVYAEASARRITIDPEHEDKGRKWIKEQIRKIKASLKHEPDEQSLFDACNERGIKRFYFGGYMDATNNRHISSRWRTAVPIWHVELNEGHFETVAVKTFSYAYGAWQGYDQVVVNPPDYL